MSKKKRKVGRIKSGGTVVARPRRVMWAKAAIVAPLLLCMVAAGAASLQWQPVRHAVGLAPLSEPLAQAAPTPLSLSKEYVYAGGRLVATEEPTPTFVGTPPTALRATADMSNPASPAVSVTWTAPSGSVTNYVIERASTVGQFSQVGQVTAPVMSFNDTTNVSEGAAYLYRVKAVFSGGGNSDYSNTDMATAVAFSDDPLIGVNDSQQRPATTIKATHLTELRRAVSAVHALAGLGAVTTWTYPDPVSSPTSSRRAIYLEDVKDLRDRLGEAFPVLGITPPSYQALTRHVTVVNNIHFQQLRDAVK